jgi:hypothetical protein
MTIHLSRPFVVRTAAYPDTDGDLYAASVNFSQLIVSRPASWRGPILGEAPS